MGYACRFGMKHDEAAAVVQRGNKGKRKDDDAKSAHPLRKCPPYQNAMATTLPTLIKVSRLTKLCQMLSSSLGWEIFLVQW